MPVRARLLQEVVGQLGVRGALLYIAKERWFRLLWHLPGCGDRLRTYRLSTPLSQYPLECRFGTTDREVFVQIFIRRAYGGAGRLKDVHTIIDCGAYVGYSAAYLLTLFPRAHLIAVEPDPHNYSILQRNLGAFGSRVTMIQAAIWSHDTRLRVQRGGYRDGGAWSSHVEQCLDDEESDVRGVDMATLMTECGVDAIDLLKVDIEGAEVMMFTDAAPWLEKVGTIMIELHEPPAGTVFAQAIGQSGSFVCRTDGELTIAERKPVREW